MFYINLDRRTDRKNVTEKLLSDYEYLNVIRYSAIDSSIFSMNDFRKYVHTESIKDIENGFRTEHHQLSSGAVGCTLSHYNLWKENYLDCEIIMIFEDDTLPNITYTQLMNEKLVELPEDWDIILLGGIWHSNNHFNKYLSKIEQFYCTHAYMIHTRGIRKLLPHLFPIKKQIDSWLSDLSSSQIINIYGIRDHGWNQNNLVAQSDIQTLLKNDI